jgi:hypothetical protein
MNEAEITGTEVKEQNLGLVSAEGARKDTPPKIGGWLIVVAIGLIVSVLQNLTHMLAAIAPLVRGPLWERLTDPNSSSFHPYWKPVIIYDAITGLIFVVMNFVAVILFFGKRRLFPKLTVALIPLFFILSFVSHYLSSFIPAIAENPIFAKQGHALIVKFVALHIWIPYFLISNRVKQTFVV